ncbi:6-phosphofructo-2-kinase [Oesophagostomum dentatum]|uniref:6-phosphofructo-2-kinase n=1 Tax=Oesophagostomum dentatum TaxID=61180 RepID=A0A0B1T2S5_OESDE|nr:6-phosphofructo-2-kinase [Oesophagostomum dentatum]
MYAKCDAFADIGQTYIVVNLSSGYSLTPFSGIFFSLLVFNVVNLNDERRAMNDMAGCLKSGSCSVATFDATNTTRERRKTINDFCKEHWLRCFFIESICDDQKIIDSNITDVKVNSPDYKGLMSAEQAKEDFMKRIENYRLQYEPIDEVDDNAPSFTKVINAGRSFFVHNVQGHVQSRVVYFLMNIHLLPSSIYVTRVRAAQTAKKLKPAFHTEYWKALDEIDAGICEGLTYNDIQQRFFKMDLSSEWHSKKDRPE